MVDRRGPGIGPEAVRRLLKRLDEERITGKLELLGTQKAVPPELRNKETLRGQWERAVGTLPADWSDYRLRWEAGHALAAFFSIVAFVALIRSRIRAGASG